MKPKLDELNSCMLFKLREYGLCCMFEDADGDKCFYTQDEVINNDCVAASLKNYDIFLRDKDEDEDFDIVAVAQMYSPIEVIHMILYGNENNIEWDWEESDDNDEEDSQCSCGKCDCDDTNSYEKGEFEKLQVQFNQLKTTVDKLVEDVDDLKEEVWV